MIKISGVIITYNEAHNIARCIRSLKPVADEIVVVDSFSTDDTVEIARSLGAKVVQKPFNGFGEQKNFMQWQAENDWVLNLDADEEISPELAQCIINLKREGPKYNGYRLNILTNYCGKWIRHCGWYPSYKLRLWNRTQGHMIENTVHEGWVLNDLKGEIKNLKGDLLHYSYPTISSHIRKIESYTEAGAKLAAEKGKNYSIIKVIFAPWATFTYDYFFRLGFLDGYWGFVVCVNSAFAAYLKYIKTRQYTREKRGKGLPR